jgi:hypothetical protein
LKSLDQFNSLREANMALGLRQRVVPRLEQLGERTLPTVTTIATNGTLVITGDQRANTITITEDTAAGTVTVVGDGVTTSWNGITSIKANAKGGADSVTFVQNGDLSTPLAVDVNLGNGNDTFVATLNGNVVAGGSLILVAHGGNGDDQLSLNATNVNVASGGNLTVALFGDNGKDDVSLNYSGLLQGSAVLSADGGNGKDNVSGHVSLLSTTDPGTGTTTNSTGSLSLNLMGGNGKDNLTAALSGETDLSSLLTVINGGRGKDTFDLSANLTAVDSATH